MVHNDSVFAALAYRRNVGATKSEIRGFLTYNEDPKHTAKEDLLALRSLEGSGLIVNVGDRWFLTSEGFKRAKGKALEARWQHSDALIFASVLYNRGLTECRLHHIIARYDWINRDIPTLAEMHGALNRLASGRLISIRKGVFFAPTESALTLLAKTEASCENRVMQIVDGLRNMLDCPCCGVRLKAVRWRHQLDDATMSKAYNDYCLMIGSKKS